MCEKKSMDVEFEDLLYYNNMHEKDEYLRQNCSSSCSSVKESTEDISLKFTKMNCDIELEHLFKKSTPVVKRFYVETEIDSELMCLCCKKRYNVPKVLSCGNTICVSCESEVFKEGSECPMCGDIHVKPRNGFPVNVIVQNLLNKTLQKVYRGEIYEKAANKITEIGAFCEKFKRNLLNSELYIRKECQALVGEIDIASESIIEMVNRNRENLVKQVNAYEAKSLENVKNLTLNHEVEFEQFLIASKQNYEKWAEFMNRQNVSDAEIRTLIDEATSFKGEVERFESKFDAIVFNSQKLKFYPSSFNLKPEFSGRLSTTVLPNVNFERIRDHVSPIVINYDRDTLPCEYRPYAIQRINFGLQPLVHIPIEFDSGRMCIVVLNNERILLKLFNETGSFIEEIQESASETKCNAIKFKNSILMSYQQNKANMLKLYDEELKSKYSTKIDHEPYSIHANENLIYVFSISTQQTRNSMSTIYQLSIFDEKLFCLQTIPLDYAEAALFTDGRVQIKHGRIFNFSHSELKIYSLSDRSLLKTLKLDSKFSSDNILFQATSTDTFCIVDRANKNLQLFNLNLDCFAEVELKISRFISSFSFTDSGRLMLMDFNNKTMTVLA